MKYSYNDAGRLTSFRPKQKQDCVVRAFALVSNCTYDHAYETFAMLGRKCGRSTPKKVWQSYLNGHLRFTRIAFPAVAGCPRMSLEVFCATFNTGRYFVQLAGHLTAVIDGTVYDEFEPRKAACVYAAWMVMFI